MGANPWITFLKEWRAKNKGESLKSSMKKASVAYRSQKSSTVKGKKKKFENDQGTIVGRCY